MNAVEREKDKIEISELAKSILKTLAYYDIFSYPLTEDEIFFGTNTNGNSKAEVVEELNFLHSQGLIQKNDKFYLLTANNKLIRRRIEGNRRALRKMKTAKRVSKLIARFPYVRAVFLSGSISKGFMDKNADIDYLIITAPNRLWFARFFLVSFKKVFLFNSYKNFCINFFIDSDSLEIEDKNIYTATECATLIPTYGSDIYVKFYEANNWIKSFFPNYPMRDVSNVPGTKRKITQLFIEPLFNNNFGGKLDDYFMNLFIKHDNQMYGNLSCEIYDVAFRTRKNISKHHPNHYQHKVLGLLKEKMKQLETRHNIILS